MPKIKIKGINLYKNGRLFGFGVSPNDDWKILFTIFLILIMAVSLLGVYMFIAIANGDIFLVDQTPAPIIEKLNITQLQKTILYYDTRAKNLEVIKVNNNQVIDPSL